MYFLTTKPCNKTLRGINPSWLPVETLMICQPLYNVVPFVSHAHINTYIHIRTYIFMFIELIYVNVCHLTNSYLQHRRSRFSWADLPAYSSVFISNGVSIFLDFFLWLIIGLRFLHIDCLRVCVCLRASMHPSMWMCVLDRAYICVDVRIYSAPWLFVFLFVAFFFECRLTP